MTVELLASTLFSAPVLAFVLGALAVAVRSDLRVPEPLTASLSLYLLLAIGLKGGVSLRETELSALGLPLAIGLALGLTIPVAAYAVLGLLTRYPSVDRGAIAAHYGSTSLVTFSAAIVALGSLGIEAPSYGAALLTALEIPGIIVGLLLARRGSSDVRWGHTLHELVTGSSIILLLGGLGIGAVLGPDGFAPIAPVFTDGFRGVLVLFLLALGIQAAQRISSLRGGAWGLAAFAIVFPLATISAITALGAVIGLGVGGAVVLGVLCASASYIAAPAAVRLALPEVEIARPLTASLSITFPVNLLVGIPLSITIAQSLV